MFSESGTLPSAKSGTLANLVLCQIQGVPSPMRTRENSMFHRVFQPGTLANLVLCQVPNLVLCQIQAVPSPISTRENLTFHRVFHHFLSAKSGTLANVVLCQIQGVRSPISTRENSMFHRVFQPGTLANLVLFQVANLVLCQIQGVPTRLNYHVKLVKYWLLNLIELPSLNWLSV